LATALYFVQQVGYGIRIGFGLRLVGLGFHLEHKEMGAVFELPAACREGGKLAEARGIGA
jgi:hypothetical protein